MKKIILASASPRRKDLLSQAGFSFEIMVSQVDESTEERVPDKLVLELSGKKARAVAEAFTQNVLVIGADTVVAIDGEILGKPKDEEDAFRMLSLLQGRTHQVYTGVTLVGYDFGKCFEKSFVEKTDVTLYPMTKMEIHSYIASKEPMDKAGAYGIQGRAAVYVKEIQGDYTNVVGLPVGRLYQEVKSWLMKG